MAAEKRTQLIALIESRRIHIFEAAIVAPLLDSLFAYLLANQEHAHEPTQLRMLPDSEKNAILEAAITCSNNYSVRGGLMPGRRYVSRICAYQEALARVINGEAPRIIFGMSYQHTPRMILNVIFAALNPFILGTPLYKQIASPLFPIDGTLDELEKINAREKNIVKLFPLFLALFTLLEATTNIKIPSIVFFMAFILSLRNLTEITIPLVENTETDAIFIENKNFDRMNHPAVFFKAPKVFTENSANQTMVELMLNGKVNPERKGDGFFLRNAAEKGYDLKARLPDSSRAYFKKEMDKDETVYHLLDNKPNRP
jgi:hypothetical protein